MGLSNLYYYSWYPEINTNSNTEEISIETDLLQNSFIYKINKCLKWGIAIGLFLLILVICSLILTKRSSSNSTSSPQALPIIHSKEPTTSMKTSFIPNTTEIYDGSTIKEPQSNNSTEFVSTDNTSAIIHTSTPFSSSIKCPYPNFPCSGDRMNVSKDFKCIKSNEVCDGILHCIQTGSDEKNCITISNTTKYVPYTSTIQQKRSEEVTTSEGYVLVQMNGIWHPYCATIWKEQLLNNICKHLGFRKFFRVEFKNIKSFHDENITNSTTSKKEEDILVIEPNGSVQKRNPSKYINETGKHWKSCKVARLWCNI